jgi:hypothetical protein
MVTHGSEFVQRMQWERTYMQPVVSLQGAGAADLKA